MCNLKWHQPKLRKHVLRLIISLILVLFNMVGCELHQLRRWSLLWRKVCFLAEKCMDGWGFHLWSCLSLRSQNLDILPTKQSPSLSTELAKAQISVSIWTVTTVDYFPLTKLLLTLLHQRETQTEQIIKLLTLWVAVNNITWLKPENVRCWRCARSESLQTLCVTDTPYLAGILYGLGHHPDLQRDGYSPL